MKKVLAGALAFTTPLMALAQTSSVRSVWDIFTLLNQALNRIVPFLIALAVVWFIWEVFQYTIAGEEEKKGKAKSGMIWGIVGIFIMVSVWGLVAILQGTFGTAGVSAPGGVNSLLPTF